MIDLVERRVRRAFQLPAIVSFEDELLRRHLLADLEQARDERADSGSGRAHDGDQESRIYRAKFDL